VPGLESFNHIAGPISQLSGLPGTLFSMEGKLLHFMDHIVWALTAADAPPTGGERHTDAPTQVHQVYLGPQHVTSKVWASTPSLLSWLSWLSRGWQTLVQVTADVTSNGWDPLYELALVAQH
jgi:hypothetical protein